MNVDPNGIGNIMLKITIIISRKKDGIIIKYYQIHRFELDRTKLEIKRENKEVVCYKVNIYTEKRSWMEYNMNKIY